MVELGVAVTVPETVPSPWQFVQFWALLGKACAGNWSTVAAKIPTAKAVASIATFGMVIRFIR